MCNFEVDESVLIPHLPPGTELDTFQGKNLVSIVGFIFEKTRIFGLPAIFHDKFEEVNLRFYVKRREKGVIKRGTVFISEIVPKPMIPLVANSLYNEHYTALPMKHKISKNESEERVRFEWKSLSGWNFIEIEIEGAPFLPPEGSMEGFIAQHYWGYNQCGPSETIEYGVEHIPWKVNKVKTCIFDIHAKELYGIEFEKYLKNPPYSVFQAQGSDVLVRTPQRFKI